MQTELDVCNFIKTNAIYRTVFKESSRLSLAYRASSKQIQVIVLGTDPANDQGEIEQVFGLEKKISPNFRAIAKNLCEIGLSTDDIYVQNLCRNYFTQVTASYPYWKEIVHLWIPLTKSDLD